MLKIFAALSNLMRYILLSYFLLTGHLLVAQDSLRVNAPVADDIPTSTLPADKDIDVTQIDTLLVSQKQGDIQTTLDYSSKDSMIYYHSKNEVHLFGNAKVKYGNKVELEADKIIFNWNTGTLRAYPKKDSLDNITEAPVFTEKEASYTAEFIKYNFKTSKGILKRLLTQQGESIIHGKDVKKDTEGSYYISATRYTTCNYTEPHFAIRARKLKMKPNKYTVTGPFNLEFNGVPTPLGFFFGIFPVTSKNRSSGIIFPTYGESVNRGFYIRDGGLFIAASAYLSLKFLFNIYSLGGWGMTMNADYKKRYAFNGNLNFSYSNVVRQEDDLSTTNRKEYWIRWSHTPISRGSSSFSANVNLGSNSYNTNNSFSVQDYISTSFNSSLNYRKTFTGTPFSMSASLRYFQNVKEERATLTPNANLNMNRIYPFRKFIKKKKGLLNNLSISYAMNLQSELNNQINPLSLPFPISNPKGESRKVDFFDEFATVLQNAKLGVTHTIPISTSFTLLKHIQVSPSFNYKEVWYPYELQIKDYDVRTHTLQAADSLFKLSRWYSYRTSLGMNTRLYMFYYLKGGITLRHQLSPSISLGYTPDFSDDFFGFYLHPLVGQYVQGQPFSYDVLERRKISRHQGFFLGSAPTGKSGSIGFSLGNQLEMKLLDKSDTTGKKFKKITILQSGNLSTSYNLMAEEFPLSNISFNGSSRILEKFNINFSGVIDPYVYEEKVNVETEKVTYKKIDKFAWNSGQGIGRLQSFRLGVTTSLQPSDFKKKKVISEDAANKPKESGADDNQKSLNSVQQAQLDDIRRNPQRYVDFKIPWSLNLNYSVSFNRNATTNEFDEVQSFSFSGDFSLMKTLKIGFNSGYDFNTHQISMTSFSIFKDLHCWQINANWVPFGPRRSYNFTIMVKSSILQDLKYERRNSWFDR